MKLIAVIGSILAVLVPGSSTLTPGPWQIKLTGTVISQGRDKKVYALYNKPAYKYRLGTGFLACSALTEDFTDCSMSMRLSRGQIISRGVAPTVSAFRQLAVTGGTGYYANVGGQLTMQALGPEVILILIDLDAF